MTWPTGKPWSIFTDGGGDGAALTWAIDEIKMDKLPDTSDNEQFFYDWEISEGGGGAYNPLNQGDDPKNPGLTDTGSQYGGGAANYTGWQAGLEGAHDYITGMSSYHDLYVDLQKSDIQQAKYDLWQSPWASGHYGYGSEWSDATPPGKATALGKGGGGVDPSKGGGGSTTGGTPATDDSIGFGPFSISNSTLQRFGLIVLGGLMILIGIWMLAGHEALKIGVSAAKATGKTGAVAAAA